MKMYLLGVLTPIALVVLFIAYAVITDDDLTDKRYPYDEEEDNDN